jgi:hypothetical protein
VLPSLRAPVADVVKLTEYEASAPWDNDDTTGLVTQRTAPVPDTLNWSAPTAALVPPGVFTRMLYTHADSNGETAEILVAEATVKLLAATAPNNTVVTPVNPVPVMVTDVPPAVGPDEGDTPVTAGTGVAAFAVVERKPALTVIDTRTASRILPPINRESGCLPETIRFSARENHGTTISCPFQHRTRTA